VRNFNYSHSSNISKKLVICCECVLWHRYTRYHGVEWRHELGQVSCGKQTRGFNKGQLYYSLFCMLYAKHCYDIQNKLLGAYWKCFTYRWLQTFVYCLWHIRSPDLTANLTIFSTPWYHVLVWCDLFKCVMHMHLHQLYNVQVGGWGVLWRSIRLLS